MTIDLLIADDHEVVRAGLKTLLEGTDIRVVAEAADGNAAFKLANKHKPDLVLLDVRMPDGDGLNCLARIKLDLREHSGRDVQFASITQRTSPGPSLGAAGYLSKGSAAKSLSTPFARRRAAKHLVTRRTAPRHRRTGRPAQWFR